MLPAAAMADYLTSAHKADYVEIPIMWDQGPVSCANRLAGGTGFELHII